MVEIELILIEDNPFDAELTLRALQSKGLADKVKVFPDGVEALEYLFNIADHRQAGTNDYAGLPKVIFLDLKLPKMSGLEVLNQIKRDERTRLIPVVMLTSSQEESDILESYELGVNSYMVKPVDYDDFSLAVGDLGLYWLRRNKTVH
ncbi:MAG: response regulator [Deltaproteobacteria bacterium]|nr:response regulator [Deltaproteobacteria bacterium]